MTPLTMPESGIEEPIGSATWTAGSGSESGRSKLTAWTVKFDPNQTLAILVAEFPDLGSPSRLICVMLAVGIIMACVWFGVGVLVGWQRSKNAYQIEFAKFPYFAETDPGSAKRSALLRGSAVFLGWAVAGLFGAILWFLLYVFLIIGRAAAEESSQSSSKKRSSSFWFWLLTGGLLLITNESLRSIEGNVDDFVIKLTLIVTFLAFLGAMFATGQ